MSVLLLTSIAGLGGCATGFTLVPAGTVAVQNLHVQADAGWNKAPAVRTPSARKNSATWTKDGMLLDRLVFVPAVPNGEPIMTSRNKSAALPVFRADMLPNELEELVESSMLKLFGEGNAVVSTGNLAPQRFGENSGVRFDIDVSVTDSPAYKGTVGAFISGSNLYLMYFLAAVPHYYDKHIEQARAIIASATVATTP